MFGLISIVVFFLSFAGMAVILVRKTPELCKLPEKKFYFNFGNSMVKSVRSGLAKTPIIKNFSYELYLQKALSKIRILTLKTESKTGSWLEKLRQKSCKKNKTSNDKYWDALKKAKNGR